MKIINIPLSCYNKLIDLMEKLIRTPYRVNYYGQLTDSEKSILKAHIYSCLQHPIFIIPELNININFDITTKSLNIKFYDSDGEVTLQVDNNEKY